MSSQRWIGRRLGGRYLLEDLLGQGGMSAVYKGNDPNLRRTVAVKLIHPHLSQDPQFVTRFEEEAAAVAQLKHPNIIQVYDFDHDNDTYYMVLEYIPGETLREFQADVINKQGSMDPGRAREIVAQVCDALEYAHQRGMIHRDIKPANIMINEQGQAILMDFGVAKIVGGKQLTATGVVVGTANYISPEQVKGEDLDRRVDLYALGIMLYEMLSGRPPFDADSAATIMMKHVNNPVPDIQRTNPNVPDDLVAIIDKALKKDRNARFSTAAEMSQALRSARLVPPAAKPPIAATTIDPPTSEPAGAAPSQTGYPEMTPPRSGGRAPAPPVSPPQPPSAQPVPSRSGGRRGLLAGGAAVLIIGGCLVVSGIGYYLYQRSGGAIPPLVEPTATATSTTSPPTATDTEVPPTDTLEPTATITLTPSPSPPPEPFVLIEGVSLSGNTYVVAYETFGYTEVLPGMHVHFFFNTVPVSEAGVPGSGPWYLWGGPRPFNGYTVSDKPSGATQMCALVANADHSIQPNTGNCIDLPQ